MTTRITLERTRSREHPRSSGNSTTEEGTSSKEPQSSPPSELLSQASIESSEEEESWDNGEREDIEPPTPPPAPDPSKRRPSGRSERPHPESHQRREHRGHQASRQRPASAYTESVDYEEHEAYGPPGQPPPGWRFVPHGPPGGPGYPPPNHGGPPPGPYPGAGMQSMPPTSSLVPYQQHDPYSAYYQTNPLSPSFGQPNPFSQGYFPGPDPYRAMPPPHHHAMGMVPYQQPPYYQPPYAPPLQQAPSAPTSPPPVDNSATEERLNKLHEMLVLQESQRKAEKELEVKAAEAKAAREAVEKIKNEAVADAAKKAKEAAETEAQEKAKKAQEEHEKALKKSKEAEETAKKAKKEAEEEAAKHKPTDDDKQAPIKFKDAVGRKFGFPWRHCKTWKGMDDLIQQAFLHVEPYGQHVREGHFDLEGPDGEIILPRVWESVVKPDWSITMHMWPMAEEKKEDPAPQPPPAMPTVVHDQRKSRSRGLFRTRTKSTKRRPTSMVGGMPGAPEAPVAADPDVASSGPAVEILAPEGSKDRKKDNRRSVSSNGWGAGGFVRSKK